MQKMNAPESRNLRTTGLSTGISRNDGNGRQSTTPLARVFLFFEQKHQVNATMFTSAEHALELVALKCAARRGKRRRGSSPKIPIDDSVISAGQVEPSGDALCADGLGAAGGTT